MKLKFLIILVALFSGLIYVAFRFFSPVAWIKTGINVKQYGLTCKYAGRCGEIIAIDCGAAVDGPFYYVDATNGEILEYCGGYCMTPNPSNQYCQNCPPQDWNCW